MNDQVGPKTLRGALVTFAPNSTTPQVLPFQYNPATLKRELKPRVVGAQPGDRSQQVRFAGPPTQTISGEVTIDATDLLAAGDATALRSGIAPQLAALELLLSPSLSILTTQDSELAQGQIEVAPQTAPRTLFVWGPNRVLPVRLESYSISEDAFDANLNPIRATIGLSMRVLTTEDVAKSNPDHAQFEAYQSGLMTLSAGVSGSSTTPLGTVTLRT